MQATYLDPSILSKIGSLDLVAKQVVEGFRIGMHKSPARGVSSEFTAYRQYVPGDEIQHIDWKSYARSDRYYIKLYEAETNFVSNMVIDCSSSMTYKSNGISKLEYAKYLAASLAYLVIDQGDSVGLGLFHGELQQYIQPTSSMNVLVNMSRELEKCEPQPRTNISKILTNFAHMMSRRGVLILFSDMLDNTEEFIKGINHLRFQGHNVIVFHILDKDELDFPFNGTAKFHGLEGEEELVTQTDRLRDRYLDELEKFISGIRNSCTKAGVDYILVNTSDPVEHVLSGYLLQRSFMNK